MTPQDLKTIRTHRFGKMSATKIILSKGKDDIGEKLTLFCEQLKQEVPGITIKKESDITFEDPVMVIGRHENIAYYTLPTGKLLSLFLDALNIDPDPVQGPSDATSTPDDLVDLPAGLKLYVADHCPHCPKSVLQMQALANATSKIHLRIINAELFAEQAKEDNIRSVPTLLLDEQFRWTGSVSTEELLTICANRNPSELSAASLRQLIEDGDAALVATMMTECGQIFPALIDLLIHQRWSVRLGAMVSVEYLADESPALGLELCQLLWRNFSDLEPQVQGDVTHIFGLINHKKTQGYLQTIVNGDFDDEVKEAAGEALTEMGG